MYKMPARCRKMKVSPAVKQRCHSRDIQSAPIEGGEFAPGSLSFYSQARQLTSKTEPCMLQTLTTRDDCSNTLDP